MEIPPKARRSVPACGFRLPLLLFEPKLEGTDVTWSLPAPLSPSFPLLPSFGAFFSRPRSDMASASTPPAPRKSTWCEASCSCSITLGTSLAESTWAPASSDRELWAACPGPCRWHESIRLKPRTWYLLVLTSSPSAQGSRAAGCPPTPKQVGQHCTQSFFTLG